MKRAVKRCLKKCLLGSGAISAFGSLRKSGVVILRYHSVLENPRDLNDLIGCGIVHSAAVFEQHMKLLFKSFVPVTMDDVFDFIKRGKALPRRAVAVTFDDGFADNASVAAPIMAQYGIQGAFYVTAGSIAPHSPPWFIALRRAFRSTRKKGIISPLDGTQFNLDKPHEHHEAFQQACSYCAILSIDEQTQWIAQLENMLEVEPLRDGYRIMMTEGQIKELYSSGHIVGSHTVSHANIAHIPENQMKYELEHSKLVLESLLGASVVHFSYPSPILQPHYNEKTIRLSREVGYNTAVTCTHGLVYSEDEPLACSRIAVPERLDEFLWRIESSLAGFPS